MLTNRQDPVSRLVFELAKLPGIGEKTATRLAYYILKQDSEYARSLSESILNAKQKIGFCNRCFTFTDQEICTICSDTQRNFSSICVVERPSDVFSIENAADFKGVYHVLHGVLSPLDGIGPEDIKINELLERIKASSINEVIFATNPSVEGEATASYLTRLIRPLGIKLTRLAHGIPMGGRLEYSDRQTIRKALENRMEMN